MRIKEFHILYRGDDEEFIGYVNKFLNEHHPASSLNTAREQQEFREQVKNKNFDLYLLDTAPADLWS